MDIHIGYKYWDGKMIYHANNKYNKASVSILISDTVEFKTKNQGIMGYFTITVSIIILICMCLIREKCFKKLTELNREQINLQLYLKILTSCLRKSSYCSDVHFVQNDL